MQARARTTRSNQQQRTCAEPTSRSVPANTRPTITTTLYPMRGDRRRSGGGLTTSGSRLPALDKSHFALTFYTVMISPHALVPEGARCHHVGRKHGEVHLRLCLIMASDASTEVKYPCASTDHTFVNGWQAGLAGRAAREAEGVRETTTHISRRLRKHNRTSPTLTQWGLGMRTGKSPTGRCLRRR